MAELPKGWEIKKLGEVCEKITDGTHVTPKYVEDGIPFLSVKDLTKGFIDFSNTRFISKEEHKFLTKSHAPKRDDILYTKVGTTGIAKVVDVDNEFSIFVSIALLKIKHNLVFNRYLEHFLNSPFAREQAQKRTRGTANKNLVISDIKEIIVNLPTSIPEQHRIVSILDEAFTAIAKAKANAERCLSLSKELFESYLQNVFTEKGEGWEEKTLSQVCEKITDGTHQTPKYYQEGFVFLSSRNVTSGIIDWENIKFIDEKQHLEMHKRVAPRMNDILLAKNGTTGVAALVDRNVAFDIYVSLALIRVLDKVIPSFMLYFINSPVAKKQFNKRLKGAGVPNLHLEEIREVIIPFPKSLKVQQSIVHKLDALSAETKKLEAVYQKKIVDLEELKKSILQKAFNGELSSPERALYHNDGRSPSLVHHNDGRSLSLQGKP